MVQRAEERHVDRRKNHRQRQVEHRLRDLRSSHRAPSNRLQGRSEDRAHHDCRCHGERLAAGLQRTPRFQHHTRLRYVRAHDHEPLGDRCPNGEVEQHRQRRRHGGEQEQDGESLLAAHETGESRGNSRRQHDQGVEVGNVNGQQ